MDKIINFFTKNKDTIKFTAEEFQIPLNIEFYKLKINGVLPPEIVDNVNEYIKKYQPEIQFGLKKFKLTALLSKITSDDKSYDDVLKAGASIPSLPKIYNLQSILLPIRSQEQTNCCVAFSTSCVIEYKNIMSKKYLDYFSPAFIYNNRENPNEDIGMGSTDAINIVKQYGVATEKIFPFDMLNKSIQPFVYENAKNYTINDFYYIKSLDTMKIAIYNNGPVMAILPFYMKADINTFWLKPANYVNSNPKMYCDGYHCINIIGYDDQSERLIIRNSWGTKWGINGYQWVSYSDFNVIEESWTFLPASTQPSESIYTTTPLDNYQNLNDSNNQILGLDTITFYSLLAGIIGFIILIIIIIIIRYKQNKNINIT